MKELDVYIRISIVYAIVMDFVILGMITINILIIDDTWKINRIIYGINLNDDIDLVMMMLSDNSILLSTNLKEIVEVIK